MERRNLLLAGIGAAAAVTSVGASQAQSITRTIRIETPEDVQVTNVLASSGNVSKGNPLFTLKSIHIEMMDIQLGLYNEHIAIMERPFNDGRIDAEIAFLKEKAEALADIVSEAQMAVDRRNNMYQLFQGGSYNTHNWPTTNFSSYFIMNIPVNSSTSTTSKSTGSSATSTKGGLQNSGDSTSKATSSDTTSSTANESSSSNIVNPDYKSDIDIQTSLDKSKAEYLDAKLNAEQADRRKTDSLDKIKLAKNRLSLYRNLLSERQASMSISAGIGGMFTPLVTEGSFVKKGHVLGEITV